MSKELDISEITDYLYVAAWPKAPHREDLIDMNIGLIISMILQFHDKELEREPLRLVRYLTVDSFLTPIPIKTFFKGVKEAEKTFNEGKKVVVYCKHGVHRSPAMAAVILISRGFTAEEAMDLIALKRDNTKPHDKHIKSRILLFEKKWKELNLKEIS